MKIYYAWTNSNHKITYPIGYFFDKNVAQQALDNYGPMTAASPDRGIHEIEVIGDNLEEEIKDLKTIIERIKNNRIFNTW